MRIIAGPGLSLNEVEPLFRSDRFLTFTILVNMVFICCEMTEVTSNQEYLPSVGNCQYDLVSIGLNIELLL